MGTADAPKASACSTSASSLSILAWETVYVMASVLMMKPVNVLVIAPSSSDFGLTFHPRSRRSFLSWGPTAALSAGSTDAKKSVCGCCCVRQCPCLARARAHAHAGACARACARKVPTVHVCCARHSDGAQEAEDGAPEFGEEPGAKGVSEEQ